MRLLKTLATDTYSITIGHSSSCQQSCMLIQSFNIGLKRFDLLLKVRMSLQQILTQIHIIRGALSCSALPDITAIQLNGNKESW